MYLDSSRNSAQDHMDHTHFDELTRKQAWCLYLSHFLSMWNSRMYEFAAILFIQAAFPKNLLASSINGIAETICVLVFSSALGRWVDRTPSRLHTLLLTISTNKFMVLASCVIWFFVLSSESVRLKHLLFALVLVLGMVEKLSRMTNILSMERDWIPTLANPSVEGKVWIPYGLTQLNTTTRRIDIICKIGAPIAISSFISAVPAHKVATLVVASVSTISWGVEYWAASKIWKENRRLQAPKRKESDEIEMDDLNTRAKLRVYSKGHFDTRLSSILFRANSYFKAVFHSHVDGLRYYLSSTVCVPSICVAILHASVLSYSATFTVYLLNSGYTLGTVTVARAVGSAFEIASTVVFPFAVARLSSTKSTSTRESHTMRESDKEEVEETLLEESSDKVSENVNKEYGQSSTPYFEAGIVRVGLCGICGLFFCLIPVILCLFRLDAVLPPISDDPSAPQPPFPLATHTFITLTLLAFLSLSFLGRWTYDLSTMQLTQVLIPAASRSSFGGTEMAIVSVFSLGHWVAAAVWNQQGDFRWLALGSFVAVGGAAGGYWAWERRWEKGEDKRRRV